MSSKKDKKRLDLDVRQPVELEDGVLKRNPDYGTSFWSNVSSGKTKSVSEYLNKRRKQRKKKLAALVFESLSTDNLLDIYLMKTAGLLETLGEMNVSDEIRQFVLEQPKELIQYYVYALKQFIE